MRSYPRVPENAVWETFATANSSKYNNCLVFFLSSWSVTVLLLLFLLFDARLNCLYFEKSLWKALANVEEIDLWYFRALTALSVSSQSQTTRGTMSWRRLHHLVITRPPMDRINVITMGLWTLSTVEYCIHNGCGHQWGFCGLKTNNQQNSFRITGQIVLAGNVNGFRCVTF